MQEVRHKLITHETIFLQWYQIRLCRQQECYLQPVIYI